ncbi:MAG: hypothetical protein FJ379_07125 [Verrucomicrobia bacterium]|nr:hypothetical protein [Verrucomicrobiota bacterium]
MIDTQKLIQRLRRPPSSVLALSMEGRHVAAAVLRQSKGTIEVATRHVGTLPMEVDPNNGPAVGKALRTLLDSASIRERQCVWALPCSEVLTTQTLVPAIDEADIDSLLQLEAEKGFHGDVSTSRVADSRCRLPDGQRWVILATISPAHHEILRQVMEAARLKCLGLSPAITDLVAAPTSTAAGSLDLALSPATGSLHLQVTADGGIAALRSLDRAIDTSTTPASVRPEAVAREIRITLGQLPEVLVGSIRHLRLHGPAETLPTLATALTARFADSGMAVESLPSPQDSVALEAVVQAGRRLLEGRPAGLEFLPPTPSALEQFLSRHTEGRLRLTWSLGMAAAALVGLFFLVQQIQLGLLESRWAGMSAKVRRLETLQQKIRQFRPWAPESPRALQILEGLTQAFPETGSVTARSIEIRQAGDIVCTGTASESASLLRMLEKLQALPSVSALHSEQIRGKSPLQFQVNFRWEEAGQP